MPTELSRLTLWLQLVSKLQSLTVSKFYYYQNGEGETGKLIIVSRLQDGRPGNRGSIPGRENISRLLSKASTLAPGTDCFIHSVPGYLQPGIERSGRKSAHSPVGKNAWNCTSTTPRLYGSTKL